MHDLIVVGGGIGGLVTAALAQRAGLRTALLEAHTKLGGCAGYFRRGPYTFDAGATALMGLRSGEVLGDLLGLLECDFEPISPAGYRVHLPDRDLDLDPDLHGFERAFSTPAERGRAARARRTFWQLKAAVGRRLFDAASRIPRLPLGSMTDAVHDLRILGLRGILAAATSLLTVQDVLRILGLWRDRRFRALIAMLLQDTAQAGPEVVPFANAAACLQAYRLGMSRPRGGMKTLAEGIGHRFACMGGDLRMATLVDRVEMAGQGPGHPGREPSFEVITRRRERLRARQVAFNVPLDLAVRLLGRHPVGVLGRKERRSRARWSAFTGYLAIGREAIPDDSPLFHQVLQDYDGPIHDGNNVLISLSACDDEGYGPAGVRIATMSTHTRPEDWHGPNREEYARRKQDYRERMLAALGRALPEAPRALVHAEFATPRSFLRYTRRSAGAVGGAPVSRSNANFLAVGSDALGPGLWLVGDSVFPGQGTMAVAISAIRAIERITGRSWSTMKMSPPVPSAAGEGRLSDAMSGTGDQLRIRPGGSAILHPHP